MCFFKIFQYIYILVLYLCGINKRNVIFLNIMKKVNENTK